MATPFIEWSHVEWYDSQVGTVTKVDGGEWTARVKLPDGRVGRISETFVSAETAMACVVRTWEKWKEKNKG